MSFRELWLVFVAGFVWLLLIVWVWYRPGRRTIVPTDHGKQHPGVGWRILINLGESIPVCLVALALLFLAGPQRLGEPQSKRSMSNIEICLDVSGSMIAEFGSGSRYDAAMKAVNDFCGFRKGDAFGLTFFGSSTLQWCPLTQDVSAIKCSPPFMRPELIPPWYGGTEIAKALRECKKILAERMDGDRMILLITDGFSSDLQGDATEQIIKELKRENITVFAVIIGDTRIQDEIIQITSATGGEAFSCDDPDALKYIFARIDQMKPAKIEKTIAEARDYYEPFCIAGFILGGLQLLFAFGLRYTPW
jgi:Ca-activated chloride channel family protein